MDDNELANVMRELIEGAILIQDEEEIFREAVLEYRYSITTIAKVTGKNRGDVRRMVVGIQYPTEWEPYNELSRLGRHVHAKKSRNPNIIRARELGAKVEDLARITGMTTRHIYRLTKKARDAKCS